MHRAISSCCIWVTLPIVLASAEPLTLYDNGAGGAAGIVNAAASDFAFVSEQSSNFPPILAPAVYDDFSLPRNEWVTEVHWTGVFLANFGDDSPPTIDDVVISIFSDATGVPQTSDPLAVFNPSDSTRRMVPGTEFSFVFEFYASINGFYAEADATYWLSIRNDTFGVDPNFFWGLDAQDSGNAVIEYLDDNGLGRNLHDLMIPEATGMTGAIMDFRLTTTVPEPTSGFFSLFFMALLYHSLDRTKRSVA